MPMTPLDSASCTSPANAPASSPVAGPDVSATYTTTTSTRSTATVPRTTNRASVVCSASADRDRQDRPRRPSLARPRAGLARRRRRQHDQHLLERREIDRRLDR